jgi:hypothetical protein
MLSRVARFAQDKQHLEEVWALGLHTLKCLGETLQLQFAQTHLMRDPQVERTSVQILIVA